MRIKLVWLLVQIAPVVASVIGITTSSVSAAEVPPSTEFDHSAATTATSLSIESISAESIKLPSHPLDQTEPVTVEVIDTPMVIEPFIQSSEALNSVFTEIEERTPDTAHVVSQNWNNETSIEWKISDLVNLATVDPIKETHDSDNNQLNHQLNNRETSNSIEFLSKLEQLTTSPTQDSSQVQFTQLSITDSNRDITNVSFNQTEIQRDADAIIVSESELLPFEAWQTAQVEASPELDETNESNKSDALDEPDELEAPNELDTSETTPEQEETSPSSRWRFTFAPYGFIPLSADGSATVRDFTADIDLGLDDILDPLNFAAAGRLEAWKGNLGFIFDGSYFDMGQENSRSLSIPNCLCNIFPSEINTEINVQYGQFDLGVGYRVAANSSNAATEFELGPIVFDAIVGIRIYAIQQEIDISTNLGTSRDLERSNTLVTPLVSGRLRWNLSPKLAGWMRADIAGLGIGGTVMAASVTGGLDWMFSGNTSLLLAYRISSLQYNTDIRGEAFKLNLLMQGPYVGIVFRF